MKKAPSADLRARVLADVASAPAPTRAQHRQRVTLVAAIGAVATTALFFVMGGFSRGTRPMELVAFTAGSGFLAALVMMRLSSPAGSMLGRPRPVLVLGCIAASPLLALVSLAVVMFWPDHAAEEVPSIAHVGCAAATLVQGSLPLVALLSWRHRSDPIHPALTGAALGMTAGAWSATMAYLRCPHVPATHCILAHVVPTLVLTALGALLGRLLLRVR